MGNLNHRESTKDLKSNSSVLNLSLKSNSDDINQNSILVNIGDNTDLLNELKSEIALPIENEYYELTGNKEPLEGKEELKMKLLFKNNIDEDEDLIFKKRSRTFEPEISYENSPRPHPKESHEYISPLKLSIKSYSNIPKWNIKPNWVLYDFQKNKIDSQSCNDEESFDDYFFFNSETERTTPNVEDLHDLLNCRKKMTIFRNSINDRVYKEYENILCSDYIFEENKEESNINNHQTKKNNFWYKHIKLQKLKDKNKINTFRNVSEPLIKIYGSNCQKNENKKENGLFILGILESAAKEKKGRYTINV